MGVTNFHCMAARAARVRWRYLTSITEMRLFRTSAKQRSKLYSGMPEYTDCDNCILGLVIRVTNPNWHDSVDLLE